MSEESYEAPSITVLGDVTDMTQGKPGIFFDFPGSAEGNTAPPPGAPGTVAEQHNPRKLLRLRWRPGSDTGAWSAREVAPRA